MCPYVEIFFVNNVMTNSICLHIRIEPVNHWIGSSQETSEFELGNIVTQSNSSPIQRKVYMVGFRSVSGHHRERENKTKKRTENVYLCAFKLCVSLSGLKEPRQLKLHQASIGTWSIGAMLMFRGTRLVAFR